VKFEIVELTELSGPFAKIYTIYIYDQEVYLFDQFLDEYSAGYSKEVNTIISKLSLMGSRFGSLDIFFRLNEGKFGDKVSALLKDRGFKLRLFCIRFENIAVILGNGGFKDTQKWQQDTKLSQEARLMMKISQIIHDAIDNQELFISPEGEFSGKMIFSTN